MWVCLSNLMQCCVTSQFRWQDNTGFSHFFLFFSANTKQKNQTSKSNTFTGEYSHSSMKRSASPVFNSMEPVWHNGGSNAEGSRKILQSSYITIKLGSRFAKTQCRNISQGATLANYMQQQILYFETKMLHLQWFPDIMVTDNITGGKILSCSFMQ